MSTEAKLLELLNSYESLKAYPDFSRILSIGFYGYEGFMTASMSSSITVKISELSRSLISASASYSNSSEHLKKITKIHLNEELTLVKFIEEHNARGLIMEFERFHKTILTIDRQLNEVETLCAQIYKESRNIQAICSEAKNTNYVTGGILLALGCFIMGFLALSFSKSGRTRVSCVVSAGLLAIFGKKQSNISQTYANISAHFDNVCTNIEDTLALSRSFRTSLKKVGHALESVSVSFRLDKAVGVTGADLWNVLAHWIKHHVKALKNLCESCQLLDCHDASLSNNVNSNHNIMDEIKLKH